MRREMVMEKQKEPVIEVSEVITKAGGTTPNVKKSAPSPVKECVPRLLYPSR